MGVPTGEVPTLAANAGQRGRSVLLNLSFSVAGQVVGVAGQLLMVPFFLRAWGAALYGDWLTLSALSSYLTLTDMGMQLYVINRLTGHQVRCERRKFDETLHSALFLYVVLSSMALAGLFVLTLGLPWRHWFDERAMNGVAVRGTVVLLGTGALVLVWCGFFGGIYRIFASPQKTAAIALAVRTTILVASLIVLGVHRGPALMAATQLVVVIAALVWTVFDLKREYPILTFGLRHAKPRAALGMLLPSALFAVLALANGLTTQGTLLITSSLLGPIAVTGFATSRTVANAVRQLVTLLNNVAWPEFTRLKASDRSPELSVAYRLLTKAGSLLAVWMVCSLWFVGPALYALWTGGRAKFDIWLFRLLLVDVLLQTPAWASGVLLTSTNRHRPLAMLYLIQGTVAVILCPIAIKIFGMVGVGLVLVGTNFPLFGFLVPSWAARELGESPGQFFRDIYGKFAPLFCMTMSMAWAAQRIGATGRLGVIVTVVVTLVPVTIGGAWWLRPMERALAISLFWRSRRRAH